MIATLALAGCKKYDNPPPVYEEPKTLNIVSRKVLIISIDGLPGAELQGIAPTNIMELKKNSKYSLSVLKSSVSTDASTWTSMVTGASYANHSVSTDDFQITPDPNAGEHDAVNIRRNILDYISSEKGTKTAVVTAYAGLRNYVKVADFSPVVSSDLAVKDSTIALLANPQLGVVVANFRETITAGNDGGFIAGNPKFKTAVLKADEYIGNIMTAIKARKSYDKEDWLVLITSNHGGNDANPSSGFIMAYNKSIKEQELKKVGFNTVFFTGKNVYAAALNDKGLYDAGNDKDFTVQMQIKVITASPGYVGFLSKGNGYGAGTIGAVNGWTMGTWAKLWKPYYNGGYTGDQATLTDGSWHTLTITMKRINTTTRNLIAYTDGIATVAAVNMNGKPMTSPEALKIGWRNVDNNAAIDFYAGNLAYFQTALDEQTIKTNLNLKDIKQHPNYNTLIGYWPMDEGAESVFLNKAPTGYNMKIYGAFKWTALGQNAPSQSNVDANAAGYSLVSTSADIGALTMYWMNVKILPEYGIDGKPFLKDFEIEFLK